MKNSQGVHQKSDRKIPPILDGKDRSFPKHALRPLPNKRHDKQSNRNEVKNSVNMDITYIIYNKCKKKLQDGVD